MRTPFITAAVSILLLLAAGQGPVLGTTLHDEDAKKTPPAEQPKTPAAEQPKTPVVGTAGPASEVGRGRADPFAPLEKKAAVKPPPEEGSEIADESQGIPSKPERVHLEGIIWSSTMSHAVINETLVGIGEAVAGWTVVSIGREVVVLECRSQTISLDMGAHEYAGEGKGEMPKEKGHDP